MLALWVAVLLGVVFQVAVIYIPILNTAFGTTPLRLSDWGMALALSSVVLWAEEVKKLIMRAIGSEKRKQAQPVQ